jgi:hypothetical protein
MMKRRHRSPKRKKALRLEGDPRFLAHIERARQSLRAGKGTRLEDLKE